MRRYCFKYSADDHRIWVWRWPGKRSEPIFVFERYTAITKGVTVREAICSPLVVLQDAMTARNYIDSIFNPGCAACTIKSSRCHLSARQRSSTYFTTHLTVFSRIWRTHMDCQIIRIFTNRALLGCAGNSTAAVSQYRLINYPVAKIMIWIITEGNGWCNWFDAMSRFGLHSCVVLSSKLNSLTLGRRMLIVWNLKRILIIITEF